MKNFLKALFSTPTNADANAEVKVETPQISVSDPADEPLIGSRHSHAQEAEFMAKYAPEKGPVQTMIAEAESMQAGCAIRSFTPVFLRNVFTLSDDVQVTARRGLEVKHFTNPTLESLGQLNTAGYTIRVQLDGHDTTSACVFRVDGRKLDTEYPLYPSMVLESGDDLLLVYRLDKTIDRADDATLYRVKGILEEVMRAKLQADLQSSYTLPLAGYFIPDKGKGKDMVRVARYSSKRYTLGELIHAFGAQDVLDEKLLPARPQSEPQVQPAAEDTLTAVMTTMSALGPLTMFKGPRFVQVTATKLLEAGLDEDTRLKLAPEFFARLHAFEPDWVKAEAITEELVTAIFAHPDDEALLTPTTKKSRKNTTR